MRVLPVKSRATLGPIEQQNPGWGASGILWLGVGALRGVLTHASSRERSPTAATTLIVHLARAPNMQKLLKRTVLCQVVYC